MLEHAFAPGELEHIAQPHDLQIEVPGTFTFLLARHNVVRYVRRRDGRKPGASEVADAVVEGRTLPHDGELALGFGGFVPVQIMLTVPVKLWRDARAGCLALLALLQEACPGLDGLRRGFDRLLVLVQQRDAAGILLPRVAYAGVVAPVEFAQAPDFVVAAVENRVELDGDAGHRTISKLTVANVANLVANLQPKRLREAKMSHFLRLAG